MKKKEYLSPTVDIVELKLYGGGFSPRVRFRRRGGYRQRGFLVMNPLNIRKI